MSVQTQPDLEARTLKAVLVEKDEEIKGLKTEKDSEVGALKNQLELRNMSVYEVCFTLTSWELQLVSFCM
jgi:hypothetical protein